jgi:hypothetical protein
MNPRTPAPPSSGEQKESPPKPEEQSEQALDRELDRELDGTFPASDPLPWSHQVN